MVNNMNREEQKQRKTERQLRELIAQVKKNEGFTALCKDCLKPGPKGIIGFTQAERRVDRTASELVRSQTPEGVREILVYPSVLTDLCYYHRRKREGFFKPGHRREY